MVEETINEVIDGFSTALSKLERENREYAAELETVRAERDALRAAGETLLSLIEHIGLADSSNGVTGGDRWDIDEGDVLTDRAIESARRVLQPALNTQPAPQAEWTPGIGQRVIVMREKDEIGHVVGKGENEFEEGYWFIEFSEPNVGFGLYELHEFKPAD